MSRISYGASIQQIINNLAGAERNIETLQRRVQAPIYQPYNIGTVSSGTVELSAKNGYMQYMVNNGAHVLTPPIDNCEIILDVTNGASSGATDISNFDKHVGTFNPATAGHIFRAFISVMNGVSLIEIVELQ